MICRLIDVALVVLKLLMFKVCVIIGISRIEFFRYFFIIRIFPLLKGLTFVDSFLKKICGPLRL